MRAVTYLTPEAYKAKAKELGSNGMKVALFRLEGGGSTECLLDITRHDESDIEYTDCPIYSIQLAN